ncbi:MAG TPA: response regulator [Chthoniobacterales bacterium]
MEDDPSHLKLAHVVLSAAGHTVLDAEAAEQAFLSIKRDRPTLILLDMVLPDMDGLTLVRRLKADPETCGIHIVAVTSNSEGYTRRQALAAGCDSYLVKPISTRTLPKLVTEVAEAYVREPSPTKPGSVSRAP